MRVLTYEIYMREALSQAKLALCEREVPVGAIVVRDGEIVACARNAVESKALATAHAELLAIELASATLGTRRLNSCTLFTTLEPCPMCMGAILNARISTLVFGAFDPIMGAAGSALELSYLNSGLRSVGGILREECEQLLSRCFGEARFSSHK